MQTNKIVIGLVALALVGVGYYLFFGNATSQPVPVAPAVNDIPVVNNPTAPSLPTPTPISKPAAPQGVTVTISNFSFNSSVLTVKPGTAVTWVNNDSVPHTITSDSGSLLHSETLSQGKSFSFTFNTPGTYSYHCSIHPGMQGEVIVSN